MRYSGSTDSICCSADTPYSNCASSGANDYIEVEGARDDSYTGFGVGHGNRQHQANIILFYPSINNKYLNIGSAGGGWVWLTPPSVLPPTLTMLSMPPRLSALKVSRRK